MDELQGADGLWGCQDELYSTIAPVLNVIGRVCSECHGRGCAPCGGLGMVLPPETPEERQARETKARQALRAGRFVEILNPAQASGKLGAYLRLRGQLFAVAEEIPL